ncbi:MAG TPA: DMT family transporter, partial [Anaeromyxobacteraceae bacterium]
LARLASRSGGGGFTAAQLTTLRFVVGIGMTLALFHLRPGTFRPVRRKLLVARGLQGGLAVLLYFVALARIPAGQATLLNNLFPVFAVGISIFTLGERPTIHLALALALVSVAVGLIVAPGSGALGLDAGVVAGVASAVLGGGAVAAIRALRPTDNAPTIFFSFCVGGLLCALPFSGGAWPSDPRLWGLALAVGVLSFFAQILMTHAYGVFTVAEAALWQQLTPAAAFLWALLILDERLSPWALGGIVLGGCGVVYGSVLGHRPAGGGAPVPVVEPVEPG